METNGLCLTNVFYRLKISIVVSSQFTQITSPVSLDVTRYDNALQANDLRVKAEPSSNLSSRQVLIVDDMIDEGETLRFV